MTTLYGVTNALVDLLRDNWEDLHLNGPDDVYYGDQSMIPRTPSITVDGSTVQRQLTDTGMRATISWTIFILIYFSPIQIAETTRRELDQYIASVISLIHSDKTLSGRVIHGHITTDEIGLADRAGTLMRTVRLTWEGISKESIWT